MAAKKALTIADFPEQKKKRGHRKRSKQVKDGLKKKKFSELTKMDKDELLKQLALQFDLIQEED